MSWPRRQCKHKAKARCLTSQTDRCPSRSRQACQDRPSPPFEHGPRNVSPVGLKRWSTLSNLPTYHLLSRANITAQTNGRAGSAAAAAALTSATARRAPVTSGTQRRSTLSNPPTSHLFSRAITWPAPGEHPKCVVVVIHRRRRAIERVGPADRKAKVVSLAARAVEAQGKGAVIAAKAAEAQSKGDDVLAAKPVDAVMSYESDECGSDEKPSDEKPLQHRKRRH